MTKERAIDLCHAINQYLCVGNPIWDTAEIHDAMSMAIEALQAQATLDDVSNAYENGYRQGKSEAQQWISVTERLPEDNTIVLICTNDGNITDGMVSRDLTDGEVWWWLAGEKQCWFGDEEKVVAWMPLPQPYEENTNE